VTWWDEGKPWIDYFRTASSPATRPRRRGRGVFHRRKRAIGMRVGNPALPAGYDYDAINADVLLHGATVKVPASR